jgi:hypothetical protein
MKTNGHHHVVPCVDELHRFHVKLRDLIELGQPLPEAVVAAMHRRICVVVAVPPFDIGIEQFPQRLAGGVEVLEASPHKVHVLLRHSPRSIPQGGGRWKRRGCDSQDRRIGRGARRRDQIPVTIFGACGD